MKNLIIICAALLSTACSQHFMAAPGDAAWAPAAPQIAQPSAATPGAIFQAGHNLNLFLDHRARQVGDTLTIALVERTEASKQASTGTDRSTSLDVTPPTVFGAPVTINGQPVFGTSLSSESAFAGNGKSSQSNRLSGNITVTVYEVLANGNLRVRGEKWLTLNQGEEFIRVSGTIRPVDLAPDNSVPSFKLADARITYSGKGVLDDANSMGWLARLFQSVLSPL
ncbi:flagellar L-ring protein precursor FlgH [Paraperlucidibaca baekdonensis]|uniref:Flagellar L-ring protein n=1 Tax=Paraperlucidibaca baekdonensis TaxID=748120 RepID=A0A3E0H391_9GAMM|nr:flagellar basal body L-ring protein FlgH [Paraperlucidibaca baekdonensis]REH36745.1 flagellar L-ring protein precursor FlgH [Paraperlucidibaca baekdonensis]